jgi:bacterioferritin (cytochrome b1)
MKRNMGDYFNKWKNGALRKVDQRYNEVRTVHQETEEAFADHVKRIKKQNCQNIKHYIEKRRLKAIVRGWRQQKNYLKKLHGQQRDIADCLPLVFQRRALQKWYHRVELTKRIRMNYATMKSNKKIRLKRLVLEGLRGRRAITTHLTTALCNLGNLLTDKAYMDAFKTVRAYSTSKKLATKILKNKARQDIESILTQTHIRRLRSYFGGYRKICKDKKHKGQRAKKIMLNIDNQNLRWAFEHWRKQNVREMLAEDLNQTGPITEEVFEANRTIKNLKDFMREQHYTEEEIANWTKGVFNGVTGQMNWLIKRLK